MRDLEKEVTDIPQDIATHLELELRSLGFLNTTICSFPSICDRLPVGILVHILQHLSAPIFSSGLSTVAFTECNIRLVTFKCNIDH